MYTFSQVLVSDLTLSGGARKRWNARSALPGCRGRGEPFRRNPILRTGFCTEKHKSERRHQNALPSDKADVRKSGGQHDGIENAVHGAEPNCSIGSPSPDPSHEVRSPRPQEHEEQNTLEGRHGRLKVMHFPWERAK